MRGQGQASAGRVRSARLLASSGLLFAATIGSWRDSGYWAAAAAVASLALTLHLSLSDRRASLQPT